MRNESMQNLHVKHGKKKNPKTLFPRTLWIKGGFYQSQNFTFQKRIEKKKEKVQVKVTAERAVPKYWCW
jgi:hypothetical protein